MKKIMKLVLVTTGLALGSLYVVGCSSEIDETEQEYGREISETGGSERAVSLGGKGTTHSMSDGTCSHHHNGRDNSRKGRASR